MTHRMTNAISHRQQQNTNLNLQVVWMGACMSAYLYVIKCNSDWLGRLAP